MIARLRPRIIDLYLARTVLLTALATWAVLLGFDLMTALFNELDEVGEGGYTLSHAVLYTAYTVPRRMYELFPTVALIGCVLVTTVGGILSSPLFSWASGAVTGTPILQQAIASAGNAVATLG